MYPTPDVIEDQVDPADINDDGDGSENDLSVTIRHPDERLNDH